MAGDTIVAAPKPGTSPAEVLAEVSQAADLDLEPAAGGAAPDLADPASGDPGILAAPTTEAPTDAVVVRVDSQDQAAQVLAELADSGLFEAVDYETYREPMYSSTPSDPYLQDRGMWGMGTFPGAGFKQVWGSLGAMPGGPDTAVIAVIDTGFAMSHPDKGENLVAGANFGDGDPTSVEPTASNHGTMVAGQIAAATDNGIGVPGAGWDQAVLVEKASNPDGKFAISAIYNAIIHAVDAGARIINMSLGGESPASLELSAINYALAHDVAVVASAGNSGNSTAQYPAAFDGVMAVAATTSSGQKASFSTYNSFVDIAAPGESILTLTGPNGYTYASGTSMAAPYAAAALALVFRANPGLSSNDAIDLLCATAHDVSPAGKDVQTGCGVIDVPAAVAAAQASEVIGATPNRPTLITGQASSIPLGLAGGGALSAVTATGLPPGLALANTGSGWVIAGTPTAPNPVANTTYIARLAGVVAGTGAAAAGEVRIRVLVAPASGAVVNASRGVRNTGTVTFETHYYTADGSWIRDVGADEVITYSIPKCNFPTGEAPPLRICTVTATYLNITVSADVGVIDPSPLAAPPAGNPVPGATLNAALEGWPTMAYQWYRNGTAISRATAATYTLPTSEAAGNTITVRRTLTYSGYTVAVTSSAATVASGPIASLKLEVDRRAMAIGDTPQFTVTGKDAAGRTVPAAAQGATLSYSLGDSCSFPAGQEPSRRTCLVTATYEGVSGSASLEVFDPTPLSSPIIGEAIPGATLKSPDAPSGWPSVSRRWYRNGSSFSTASSYKLSSREPLGGVITLTRTMTYQGLTISGTAPALTVGVGAPASLAITPAAKAVSNAGGVVLNAVAKDAYGNEIPGAQGATQYSYSLGAGCQFPSGQAPSRRTCVVTGTFAGLSATASVEVFDPAALAGPIEGEVAPGARLTAGAPEGWPSVTYRWYRNGSSFSTSSTYRLSSSEKMGNAITVVRSLSYQGLSISGTSPAAVVAPGAVATLTLTPAAKAVANTSGVALSAVGKDAYGNVVPEAAAGVAYTYSTGPNCTFATGQEPSRRTCAITGRYAGISGTTSVEVFDPSALAAPIQGSPTPKSTLSVSKPSGWPSISVAWYRNGSRFSTASSYRLPSSERVGNVITVTLTMTYQGLTISGTSPAVVVTS
ncbi:MAG: S8 family serine peptidase [Bifidobacteriaceae bacterium]|nr:S8 family serine peptidase [Bifidobacteriaceae bacterium]